MHKQSNIAIHIAAAGCLLCLIAAPFCGGSCSITVSDPPDNMLVAGPLGGSDSRRPLLKKIKDWFHVDDNKTEDEGDEPSTDKRREWHPLREIIRVTWAYFTAPLTLAESARQIITAVTFSVIVWVFGQLTFQFTRLFYGREPRDKE